MRAPKDGLALLHAGVPDSDEQVKVMLKAMLEAPLERTYPVALQAMILEEVDRVRHQERIAACAQLRSAIRSAARARSTWRHR